MIKYALILLTTTAVASKSPSLPTIPEKEKVESEISRKPKAYWRYDAYNLPPPLPMRMQTPRAKRIVPAKPKSPVIPFPEMVIAFEAVK